MPSIGTCFRFYTQMRVENKTKHLHIEFIVTSHNSVYYIKINPEKLHPNKIYSEICVNWISKNVIKFIYQRHGKGY